MTTVNTLRLLFLEVFPAYGKRRHYRSVYGGTRT